MYRVAILVAFLLRGSAHAAEDPKFAVVLQFPVTDERPEFSVALSRDVLLKVRRAVDAHGHHMGWDLSATDRRVKGDSNFFYECLCGHGPRPHDLYAWHFVSHYYPGNERRLPIYGYPLDVRVRCVDCEVDGSDGTDARFLRGTVEISVRPLMKSNPRQLRISDIVGKTGAKQ